MILEAGSTARSVVLLISGTVVARGQGICRPALSASNSDVVVDVRCCARVGLPPTDEQQQQLQLVQDYYIGEHDFLTGNNLGPAARLQAHTEVECLLVAHDVLELLSCNEPLIGIRFFRSLAMSLARYLVALFLRWKT